MDSAKNTGKLKITTHGDREILMTRDFDAPRSLVFEALTKPELVKKWLLGPDGWTMPVCQIDLKVCGNYCYEWHHAAKGKQMVMTGVFREIVPPKRLVQTECFEDPWYPGEGLNTSVLVEKSGKTTLTVTCHYESKQIRDTVIKSGMESGVAASYDRLAAIVEQGGN